ncbi:MAG: hypothetical protein ACK578_14870 [Pirellula sp.]|jgi:phosphoglycolate phosphatase-like HAD superfamily hydrolase
MRPLELIMDQGLLDAAKLHARAVKIIANALKECSHPSLKPEDHEGNATAILARLAHANILIDNYDPAEETREPQWPAAFEGWLQKRYAALVFTYNESGLGVHKRLADEVKDILERLHDAKTGI